MTEVHKPLSGTLIQKVINSRYFDKIWPNVRLFQSLICLFRVNTFHCRNIQVFYWGVHQQVLCNHFTKFTDSQVEYPALRPQNSLCDQVTNGWCSNEPGFMASGVLISGSESSLDTSVTAEGQQDQDSRANQDKMMTCGTRSSKMAVTWCPAV